MEEFKLSSKGRKELDKIREEVDEKFKDLWKFLDEKTPKGFSHKDVKGFGFNLYIIDKKTGDKVYFLEKKEVKEE